MKVGSRHEGGQDPPSWRPSRFSRSCARGMGMAGPIPRRQRQLCESRTRARAWLGLSWTSVAQLDAVTCRGAGLGHVLLSCAWSRPVELGMVTCR